MNTDTTGPAPPRTKGPRIAALVASGTVGLFALGLFGGGGAALWADSEKDANGYLSTAGDRIATTTNAVTTENLDLDFAGLDVVGVDQYGKVRLQATSNDDKPVFVGIAPTRDVENYLRGSAHSIVTDVDFSPFHADYDDRSGDRTPAAPAGKAFWAASANGAGTQSLTWDVKDGDWSVVVMNADGSPGVDAELTAGAELGFLDEAGWILLGGAVLASVLMAALLYAGVRPPRGPRSGAAPQPTPLVAGLPAP